MTKIQQFLLFYFGMRGLFSKFYNSILPSSAVNKINIFIFCLAIFNTLYKMRWIENKVVATENLWNPTWLLFGPMLYRLYILKKKTKLDNSKLLLHLLPFITFGIGYLYTMIQSANQPYHWLIKSYVYYQNSFFVIPISLCSYSIWVLSKLIEPNPINNSKLYKLIFTLSATYILISLVHIMMYLAWGIIHVDTIFDYRIFIYTLLLSSCLTIINYWIPWRFETKQTEKVIEENSYQKSTLSEDQVQLYKNKIVLIFEQEKIFLNPTLSLDSLSAELQIPKHYLSQIFNHHFNKSFHYFIANYRINYAIELLKENHGLLKIESLCYSCGFNSKSSFNRYFKELTGYAPSDYLNLIERENFPK